MQSTLAAAFAGSKGTSAFEPLDAQGPAVLATLLREWTAANASDGEAGQARTACWPSFALSTSVAQSPNKRVLSGWK